jgi:hypothetical protein
MPLRLTGSKPLQAFYRGSLPWLFTVASYRGSGSEEEFQKEISEFKHSD